MSIVRKEGKDTIIFASKEDHSTPSKIDLPEPEPRPGLILPNGEINWGCPCLGGMATGPCGLEFREAFSCFHYSEAEPKGSECYEAFKTMQSCMAQYPSLYGNKDIDVEDNGAEDSDAAHSEKRQIAEQEKNEEEAEERQRSESISQEQQSETVKL